MSRSTGAFNDLFQMQAQFRAIKQDADQRETNELNRDLLRQKLEFARSTEELELQNLQAESDLFAERLKSAKFGTTNQQRVLDDQLATNLASRGASAASVASSGEQLLLFKDQRKILNDNQAEAILQADDGQADELELKFNQQTTSQGRQDVLSTGRQFVAQSQNGKPLLALKIEQLDKRDKAGTAETNRPLAKTPQELIIRENDEAMRILRAASPATADALLLKTNIDQRGGRVTQSTSGGLAGLGGDELLAGLGGQADPLTAQTNQNLSNALNQIIGNTLQGTTAEPGVGVSRPTFSETLPDTAKINPDNLENTLNPTVGKQRSIKEVFQVLSKAELTRFNPEAIERKEKARGRSAIERGARTSPLLLKGDKFNPVSGRLVTRGALTDQLRGSKTVMTNKINKATRDGVISKADKTVLSDFNSLLGVGAQVGTFNVDSEGFKFNPRGNIVTVESPTGTREISIDSFSKAQKIAMRRIVGSALLHKNPQALIQDLDSTTVMTDEMKLLVNAILSQVTLKNKAEFVGPELP